MLLLSSAGFAFHPALRVQARAENSQVPSNDLPAAQGHKVRVGKQGDLTFRVEMKLVDLTLKPGRYFIRHRVAGTDNFVQFTEVTKPHNRSGGGVPVSPSIEVKCRLVPLEKKVHETTIIYANTNGGVREIKEVLVVGENVGHAF